MPQISEIRHKESGGQPMLEDPSVEYMVGERNGKITAIYGYKIDETNYKRALIVDMYGTNARDWYALYQNLLHWADDFGVELSGWVDVRNKHIKTFWKTRWAPHLVLLRRQPELP